MPEKAGQYGHVQPLRDAYRQCMDYAFQQVFTGATDYNTAIRQATRNLADKGVRVIDYESGVHTSLEAAVRRNIMGGLGLMQEQISQQNHDEMGADGWEINAHAACAPDHEPIQGRQYSDEAFKRLNGSLKRRIGTLNCGHKEFPIILGVSEPQYSPEELEAMRQQNAKGVTIEGRHYSLYEATQMQRKMERSIRKQKKRILVDKATGDEEKLQIDQTKLRMQNTNYKRFSDAAGLRTQRERAQVAGFGRKEAAEAAKAKKFSSDIDFMGTPKNFTEGAGVLDIKAYQVKGTDTIYSQTYSKDAQNTVDLIKNSFDSVPELKNVSEIVVSKNLPGIAAYDHVSNRLYIHEGISNAKYLQEQLSGGYFVAENGEDILRHEMYHKSHWDKIKAESLTTGKSYGIIKQEMEADLEAYVKRQVSMQPSYIKNNVSKNASFTYAYDLSLNELIADTMLREEKGITVDRELLRLVRRCIK